MSPDVLSRTERLVAADTAPGCETAALAEELAVELREQGAHVQLQAARHESLAQHNLVARFGGDGPAGLVLAGHLDTVPWAEGSRATIHPERDARRLYGRGSCDMKGALAAQWEAVLRRQDALRRPVVLCWTWGEEVGCHGAKALVADPTLLGDLSAAVAIVGEPTDLTPITTHKGYVILEIELRGESAHSSDPWAGCDASVGLAVLLRDLHALREALRAEGEARPGALHEPPGTTLNTGLVTAGSARNVVPDRATLNVELRPVAEQGVDELLRRVEACVNLACSAVPGLRAELRVVEDNPAYAQPHATRLVQWLSSRLDAEPTAVPFYTEAELYRAGLQLPVVVCGPGSIRQAHRVDESVAFDELEAGVELYADALDAFCD